MVLANLIGIMLFGGTLAPPSLPSPDAVDPFPRGEVCLLERSCDRPPEFCLLKETACDAGNAAPVCLLDDCSSRPLRLGKAER